jgi:UDP-N-acetylmuramoyl-tripeptide--D-alanyl-D-alanine ligase
LNYTTQDVSEATGGVLSGDGSVVLRGGEIDTRRDVQGKVFFALQGEQTDGHKFIERAIEMGCAAVVVSKEVTTSVPVITVENTRRALFQLAEHVRSQIEPKTTIAITGSVGKTITKDLLAKLLGKGTTASPASFNNDLGIPLTILDAVGSRNIVVEVGANACGEIEPLARLVAPDIAIITSIQKAHLKGFGSIDTILNEKIKLFEALDSDGIAIVPEDIPVDGFILQCDLVTVGESKHADIRIRSGCDENGFTRLDVGEGFVTLNILGKHNAMNATCAIVAAKYAHARQGNNVSLHSLLQQMSSETGPVGRLSKEDICGVRVIDDSYNASPASMCAAIETLASMSGSRKVAILGDMLELGEECDVEHRRLGGYLSNQRIDQIILVGSEMASAVKVLPTAVYEENADDATMLRIANSLRDGDLVLLKGSRGMQLERIVGHIRDRYAKVSSP